MGNQGSDLNKMAATDYPWCLAKRELWFLDDQESLIQFSILQTIHAETWYELSPSLG